MGMGQAVNRPVGRGCISNWGQIGRLQVAATIAKSTCVDYTPKLKCTRGAPTRLTRRELPGVLAGLLTPTARRPCVHTLRAYRKGGRAWRLNNAAGRGVARRTRMTLPQIHGTRQQIPLTLTIHVGYANMAASLTRCVIQAS